MVKTSILVLLLVEKNKVAQFLFIHSNFFLDNSVQGGKVHEVIPM